MQGEFFGLQSVYPALLLLAFGVPCLVIQTGLLYLKKPRPVLEAVSVIFFIGFILTVNYHIGHRLTFFPQLASYASER